MIVSFLPGVRGRRLARIVLEIIALESVIVTNAWRSWPGWIRTTTGERQYSAVKVLLIKLSDPSTREQVVTEPHTLVNFILVISSPALANLRPNGILLSNQPSGEYFHI